jgi:hypothetical protein
MWTVDFFVKIFIYILFPDFSITDCISLNSFLFSLKYFIQWIDDYENCIFGYSYHGQLDQENLVLWKIVQTHLFLVQLTMVSWTKKNDIWTMVLSSELD